MQKADSEVVCKVTTDSKHEAALFQFYSQFLTMAYKYIGVTMYVEGIAGGAIVFYQTLNDFLKFHEFSVQLPPIPRPAVMPPARKKSTLVITIEFAKRPAAPPIQKLAEVMEGAHRRLSQDISVKVTSPTTILLRYKNAAEFEVIFKGIWETLGKMVLPDAKS